MPELPEVETVVRQLAPLLQDKRILSLRVSDPLLHGGKGLRLTTRNVSGAKIASVFRSGKQAVMELEWPGRGKKWLVTHLRMTGRLLYFADGERLPARQRRMILKLSSGSLGFYDTRRFGTAELHDSWEAFQPAGVDPVLEPLTAAKLRKLISDSPQEIKAWLLRQDKLVGLGNIYACEILHRAGIDPRAAASSLDRSQLDSLARAVQAVLKAAIRNCGTTFSDFQDSQGQIGGYQRFLKVYGRAGQQCRSCGNEIDRIVQQQRSTFYCPRCQT